MTASDLGSRKIRRGRGVTRVADVTSGRVDGQRRHVDIDPRSGHPSRPNADRFRSYLGKLAKSHVSILHACWDDAPEGKRLSAQERQRLNDAPHLLSRGGYAKLEKKLRKSRADALGLESPDLAPAPAKYELWKAARTKSDGNMTSSSAALISQRIFTRPQKQPIHDTVIHEDDDMAEAEDDPLSKLMTRLPRLKKAPLELYWDLRVFGLPPHMPIYITFSNALEVIGGNRMLNISIIQLWCMYMDTIVVDQGRSSMYGFVEPQTIQPSGKTLQNRQQYLQTWMDERMKNDLRTMLQGVIGKSRGQVVQILYPKVCNQQLDSWECGFYVMCWIKTIIRAVITDDWNERFKSTSPIPEDTIRHIR
ncbi:hypothetical protein LR48_Vigan10g110100 [Vigna angularis]|uniref:Ubiquitin-like protease family profile domain-containing protein n=1 Tax=Phaseolus angularis TaxID=3914 RepID=A0A0L9VKE6_PHAAN|nr:hypothetical protein LR48_Vigan10g110100 [Vigna angularis]